MFRRIKREQDGAVAVMVAVTLIVMIGMLVLTVDVGRLWTARRKLSTGADAAAIAAAQRCALGQGPSVAQQFGNETGSANENGAYAYRFTPDCPDSVSGLTSGAHFVTVDGSEDISLVFAPIFGIDSKPVGAQAVVKWGPVSALNSPVPIRIDQSALTPCISQPAGSSGSACAFAFDNDPNAAQWGMLNFPEGWPTSGVGPPSCNAAGGQHDVSAYITGTGTPFQASVPADPGYVYVCAQSGEEANTINVIIDMIARSAPNPFYMMFPVMSASQPILDLGGNREAVPIMGFTRLRILGAWKGQQAKQHCTFSSGAKNSSLFCIQTQWDGDAIVPGVPGGGLDFGPRSVRLVG